MSVNKPRLGLESLEAREVPAGGFVGGWGSSMYQHVDPDNPNVIYIGGSRRLGGSAGRVTGVAVDPADPPIARPPLDFPLDIRGVDAEPREGKHNKWIEIPWTLPPIRHVSRDQFVFGVEMPTAAKDFPLDIRGVERGIG
jgi:hypothetical protein